MHPVKTARASVQSNEAGLRLLARATAPDLSYHVAGLPERMRCVIKVWHAEFLGDPTWRPEAERCLFHHAATLTEAEAFARAWAIAHPLDMIRCTVQRRDPDGGMTELMLIRRQGRNEAPRSRRMFGGMSRATAAVS